MMICAVSLSLFAAGCGGSNAPPSGSGADPGPIVQDLIKKLNDQKLKSETRAVAAIQLGNLKAQDAIPHLEKAAAGDPSPKVKEHAAKAIRKIKGEE
jgi:hypothetical protein